MLEERELLQTLVFLSILAAHMSITKTVSFNNMINSAEKLIRWCINKGLLCHASHKPQGRSQRSKTWHGYLTHLLKNENWPVGLIKMEESQDVLYIQTTQRLEFNNFSSFFFALQLSLIHRMHFLMSTLTSLLINCEINAIFFNWNRTRTSHTCSCWLSGGKSTSGNHNWRHI